MNLYKQKYDDVTNSLFTASKLGPIGLAGGFAVGAGINAIKNRNLSKFTEQLKTRLAEKKKELTTTTDLNKIRNLKSEVAKLQASIDDPEITRVSEALKSGLKGSALTVPVVGATMIGTTYKKSVALGAIKNYLTQLKSMGNDISGIVSRLDELGIPKWLRPRV